MDPHRDVVFALALESVRCSAEIYTLDERGDAPRFAVVLRPYTVEHLVHAHHELMAASGHGDTARVLYIDGARALPPPLQRARRVALDPPSREIATNIMTESPRRPVAGDDAKRATDDASRATAEAELTRLVRSTPGEVVGSLETGLFEIVSDPFAAPSVKRPRILVADDDPTTFGAVGRMGDEVDVERVTDGWVALDRLATERFDLVLCALKLGDLGGAKIFKMIAKERPDTAARIFFVADRETVIGAPPSSASGRVLARPISPDDVRALLGRLGPCVKPQAP